MLIILAGFCDTGNVQNNIFKYITTLILVGINTACFSFFFRFELITFSLLCQMIFPLPLLDNCNRILAEFRKCFTRSTTEYKENGIFFSFETTFDQFFEVSELKHHQAKLSVCRFMYRRQIFFMLSKSLQYFILFDDVINDISQIFRRKNSKCILHFKLGHYSNNIFQNWWVYWHW